MALSEAIRRREIRIVGAARWWRNPDTDLPPDVDTHRDVHDTAIAQPTGTTPRWTSVQGS